MASKIKVVEKNEGTKIDYSVSGTKITFNDELMVNLQSRERDYAVTLDICKDKEEGLTVGVNVTTEKYVAQIEIPARKYETVENGVDENDMPLFEEKPLPFEIGNCTLILWALI